MVNEINLKKTEWIMRILMMLMGVGLAFPVVGQAELVNPAAAVEGYQVVGQSHYSRFGITVFDAVLMAPGGNYRPDGEFALVLTYQLSLKGERIAHEGRKEMALQGKPVGQLDEWEAVLKQVIPNVVKGDTLTAVRDATGHMVLLKNRVKVGRIDDVALVTAFFNIWLGEKVSDRGQRDSLLGRK